MRRRSLALDAGARQRLRVLGDFYQATHSAVTRLALADLAARVASLQRSAEATALGIERRRIEGLKGLPAA